MLGAYVISEKYFTCHINSVSPSRLLLYFQFFSAAAASTAVATTLASHAKPFQLQLRYWGKETIILSDELDDLSMALCQGHGSGTDEQKIACLLVNWRTTHPITTALNAYISLVMRITWLDLKGIIVDFFCECFYQKSECVLLWSNTFGHISDMVGVLLLNCQCQDVQHDS